LHRLARSCILEKTTFLQGTSLVYMAKQIEDGRTLYFIRESYRDGTRWKSRDLAALGEDPKRWVHAPDRTSYYIDEAIEDALRTGGVEPSQEQLEEIFWLFLDPAVRRVILRHSPRRPAAGKRVSRDELAELQKELHIFDKRRLHFLRYGAADLRNMPPGPMRAYNCLLRKSRDEIEQMIEGMEAALRPDERRLFIYFVFDLQRFFSSPLAGKYPQAMDPDTMDEAFLAEVCRLQADPVLFPDEEGRAGLDPVLVRYVIMYFDNEFRTAHPEGDYVRDFMGRRRAHGRAGLRRPRLPLEEACKRLEISRETFERASLRDLAQHYRKKALESHPDRGGTHEAFIRLTRAYRDLLARRCPVTDRPE